MRGEEKIAKARRQLILVGVVCVAIVVFTIWLVTLPRTLAENRERYSSPATLVKKFQELWKR